MGTLKPGQRPSLEKRLNTRLSLDTVWGEFAKAVDTVVDKMLTEPRQTLSTTRDPYQYRTGDWIQTPNGLGMVTHIAVLKDETVFVYYQTDSTANVEYFEIDGVLKERFLLVRQAEYNGFKYFSDTLSDKDYGRINKWVENYWPESGTENFIRFLSYIKSMKTHMETFWSRNLTNEEVSGATPDEIDIYPILETYNSSMVPVWEGGIYYPTSHVQLVYDLLVTPDLDQIDLLHLFYQLAPIQLVLERVIGELTGNNLEFASILFTNSVCLVESASFCQTKPFGEYLQ